MAKTPTTRAATPGKLLHLQGDAAPLLDAAEGLASAVPACRACAERTGRSRHPAPTQVTRSRSPEEGVEGRARPDGGPPKPGGLEEASKLRASSPRRVVREEPVAQRVRTRGRRARCQAVARRGGRSGHADEVAALFSGSDWLVARTHSPPATRTVRLATRSGPKAERGGREVLLRSEVLLSQSCARAAHPARPLREQRAITKRKA